MFVIAESGSTKTDWFVYNTNDKQHLRFQSAGINPYFSSGASLKDCLNAAFKDINADQIQQLNFYGPGCSLPEMQDKLRNELQLFFTHADISVHSDLLAAARGLFGKQDGIACILGTGSNSGIYSKQQIVKNLPSLGYMFGDEGSGAHMGKQLITDFLTDEMPQVLKTAFIEKYRLTYKDILDNVYSKPYPNRFFASFAPFLNEYLGYAYCKSIVDSSMDAFFTKQISKYAGYEKYTLRFTGSIAYAFQDVLVKVAKRHNILLDTKTDIVKSPLAGLIDFHLNMK